MRVLILGGGGFVGRELERFLRNLGLDVIAVGHAQGGRTKSAELPKLGVDITSRRSLDELFLSACPDAVVNCAALASVPLCEESPQLAEAVNTHGVANLVASMQENSGRMLIHLSTDMVFSGSKGSYRESDEALPTTTYGRTKLRGEQNALNYQGPVVILRPSLILGKQGGYLQKVLTDHQGGRKRYFFRDEWRTPTYLKDLLTVISAVLYRAAETSLPRVMHVGGPDRVSRLELGRRIFEVFSLDPSLLLSASQAEIPGNENRPKDCSLDSSLLMESLSLPLTGLSDALWEIQSSSP